MLIEKRSQICILFQAGISLVEIAFYTGRHIRTVAIWVTRMATGEPLHDRTRSGRPATFTEQVHLKITAFFCQTNPLPGCNSISLKWAANFFNGEPFFLGCEISISSISRILRKHSLRPHLHKYFLQITDPRFFEKMEVLVNLYLMRPKYLFCFDECPGLQALERLAPPLPPVEGDNSIKRIEPNHSRNGTTDLYAFLDVNTGKVFGECAENHKVDTLIRLFKKHVNSLPDDAVINYICDNLSNHSCHEFCQVVAELSSIDYPKNELDTKEKRQEWLQKKDKRIMIHFTPKHGSWLNMVEIWFGILGQKCLKHNSFRTVEELVAFIHDFIRTWCKHFAHPFNWTYDGTGLHSKVVQRFITHISIENKNMEINFLSDQMELMINLLQNYFGKVQRGKWSLLADVIQEKMDYIQMIIQTSEKPRKKTKAEILFPEMLSLLKSKIAN